MPKAYAPRDQALFESPAEESISELLQDVPWETLAGARSNKAIANIEFIQGEQSSGLKTRSVCYTVFRVVSGNTPEIFRKISDGYDSSAPASAPVL